MVGFFFVQVTWAPLPAGAVYVTDTSYDAGPLGALFNMATGFLNIVYRGEFPIGQCMYKTIHTYTYTYTHKTY